MANYEREAEAICGALVREISRAKTWNHMIEAWSAILNVRRMQKNLEEEQHYLSGGSGATMTRSDNT